MGHPRILRTSVRLLAVLVVTGMVTGAARTGYAQKVYLTQAEALRQAFPDEEVRAVPIRLRPQLRRIIERESGVKLHPARIRCFQGLSGGRVVGYACIDHVIGKDRPITYLVRIDHPSGKIALVEVMVYRESIGAEVRMLPFRKQFEEKTVLNPLRIHEDIRNISGATLSSRALAAGSRKMLHLYHHYLRDLPGD